MVEEAIGTNDLLDALTWLIQELRFCKNDFSATDFLHCKVCNLLE